MSDVAEILKKKLKAHIHTQKDLSQKIVADRAGLSRGYLSRVLSQKRGGDLDLFARIAEAAGTTIQELMADQPKSTLSASQPQMKKKAPAKNILSLGPADLIDNFSDTELLQRILQRLLTLEELDTDRLELIEKQIEVQILEAKIHNRAAGGAARPLQIEDDSLKKKSA